MKVDRGRRRSLGSLRFGRQVKSRVSLGLLLVLLGLGVAANPGVTLAENVPEMLVRVINYAQVPSDSLNAAEREAGRIFSAAGLLTRWVNCSGKGSATDTLNPCNQPLSTNEIVLRLISKSPREPYRDSVFGFAVVPVVASVYVNCAVRGMKRDNAEFEVPVILGSVIAHEIGHLMLGLNSHSVSGIMQKRWERRQLQLVMMGNLLFTGGQGKLMRAEMQRRTGVKMAANQ